MYLNKKRSTLQNNQVRSGDGLPKELQIGSAGPGFDLCGSSHITGGIASLSL